MKTLVLLTFLFAPSAFAKVNCDTHKIYCNIVEVNPKVDKTFAMTLSNNLYKYSKRYGTDPLISVAIAMQESSIRNVMRRDAVYVKEDGSIHKGISDIGVFQIHVNTVENFRRDHGWDIDIDRLIVDVDYQVYWHIRLLKHKVNTCKKLRSKLKVKKGNEWSCYHSYTFSKRKKYLNDVSRHIASD